MFIFLETLWLKMVPSCALIPSEITQDLKWDTSAINRPLSHQNEQQDALLEITKASLLWVQPKLEPTSKYTREQWVEIFKIQFQIPMCIGTHFVWKKPKGKQILFAKKIRVLFSDCIKTTDSSKSTVKQQSSWKPKHQLYVTPVNSKHFYTNLVFVQGKLKTQNYIDILQFSIGIVSVCPPPA